MEDTPPERTRKGNEGDVCMCVGGGGGGEGVWRARGWGVGWGGGGLGGVDSTPTLLAFYC